MKVLACLVSVLMISACGDDDASTPADTGGEATEEGGEAAEEGGEAAEEGGEAAEEGGEAAEEGGEATEEGGEAAEEGGEAAEEGGEAAEEGGEAAEEGGEAAEEGGEFAEEGGETTEEGGEASEAQAGDPCEGDMFTGDGGICKGDPPEPYLICGFEGVYEDASEWGGLCSCADTDMDGEVDEVVCASPGFVGLTKAGRKRVAVRRLRRV